jgi:hypothetical protein
MEQQTAVGWIEDNIQSDMTFMEIMGLIRQAKAMEREHIIKSYIEGAEEAKKIFKEELQEFIVLPKDFTYNK